MGSSSIASRIIRGRHRPMRDAALSFALISFVAVGCGGGSANPDGGVTDLAVPDLVASDLASGGPFTVTGSIYDFATDGLNTATVTVAAYEPLALLSDPQGPPLAETIGTSSYALNVNTPPSGELVIVVQGPVTSARGIAPLGATSATFDLYVVPATLVSGNAFANGAVLAVFFDAPSPAQHTLAVGHEAAGVTLSVAAGYIAASRSAIDPTATATSATGAALIGRTPLDAGSISASGGPCDGGCAWPSLEQSASAPGVVFVEALYR